METLNLKQATEKIEAILLTRRRKFMHIILDLQETIITLSTAVKYIGVWLYTKMTFAEHVNGVIIKAEKTTTTLANLIPNVRGPRSSKRRILSSVAHSQHKQYTSMTHNNPKQETGWEIYQNAKNNGVCSAKRCLWRLHALSQECPL